MRESGFDPTDRFGPFGAGITRLVPVCLNTLLYAMELDLAAIDAALGTRRPTRPPGPARAAGAPRSGSIAFLWDERAGLYLDYDFEAGAAPSYPFATTFWPLWAGLASPAQARRVRDNLADLRAAGRHRHQHARLGQPVGRAVRLGAAAAPRRRGAAARRLRRRRRSARARVPVDARRRLRSPRHAGREVRRRAPHLDAAGRARFGYTSNEIGFGWTNAVALVFMRETDNPPPASGAEPR